MYSQSTNRVVIPLVEKVAKALDTGKIVIGVHVYLDIKKASDVISHPMLLASEVIFLIGLKATLLIDYNVCHIIMLNPKPNVLHMVFLKDPS